MTQTGLFSEQAGSAGRTPPDRLQSQSRYFLAQPLLSRLFDAIPEAIMILNEKRQIIFANRALFSVPGVSNEQDIWGLRPGEAFNCVRAFETKYGCGSTEFCATCGAAQAILSSLKGQECVQEYRIIQRSGNALDLQVWTTPLPLDSEHFTVFAVKDVSHEKRRRALERIFFHDLLNSASSLYGFAELLQGASEDELDGIKTSIYELSEQLVEEINAQRELTAAEDGELNVHPIPLDSLELLHEVADQYQRHHLSAERDLQISPVAQSIWFISDKTLLRRVLSNMVKNALEASWPGETITLSCTAPHGEIEFTVHNPNYMARQVQLQIFQRSFSTKGEGRGLGTYSIKLLTERYLHGSVTFISRPDDGTTFVARYPLKLDGDVGEDLS